MAEDRPGGNSVILLGYDLWQRLFHGDSGVLGHVLNLSQKPYTVIGVLPREAVVPPNVDAWVPLAADLTKGGSFYLTGVGRLKPGFSMVIVARAIGRTCPDFPKLFLS